MGRKRKSGEGTIRLRKDGRWEGRVVICRGFLRNRFSILYSIGDRVRGLPFREAVCSEKSRNSRPSS